ncbi:MAG TPA: hypothetical protein VN521_03715 [Negativicutes bacterium]|nr:hypothetical protein [Negativicutes bacterium]
MATLFKERISRFGSLISLIALTAMLAVYSLSLPEFLASPLGRAFAVAWAAIAIIIFVAHARRLSGQRRRLPDVYRAAERGRQPQKETQRAVRQLRD